MPSVNRYMIERELGRGPELAASLGPDRLRREIETAARLQHPHICSVHDSGEAASQYLRIDHAFAPLRGHPRFQRLVAEK